uniref:Uncharacterized protein n=1 Tax=Paraburkholderia sprentiae WSM5005 TaxID=754502 RepID=A0A1I9YJM8_9BURK|nr:hypothetical protein [Paraburkholderia sprentiae]
MLSDDTLLFVVDKPVESEPMPLVTVDKPVEVDALKELRPVLAEVERLEIPVLAETLNEERPVLSDDTPVDKELTPVDSELMLLVAVDRPVDKELTPVESDDTPVLRLEIPVEVLVESDPTAWFVASSCEPFTASVELAFSRPAATFVICRSAPLSPTLTTLFGAAPAKLYDFPPIVALEVGFAAAVTEPEPKATSPAFVAVAF